LIEKAERNMLPILNNILEDREMQLDNAFDQLAEVLISYFSY
jgi:hypothetical protein